MEDQNHTTGFTLVIDNFSEKESEISSPIFLSGGCEWFVNVLPKGVCINDQYMYMYLYVANPESLRLGWKIRASYSFVVLNQSLEELCRYGEVCQLFCDQLPGWGRNVHLEKLKKKGFLEKNKLILKVEVKVVEEGDVTGNEMLEFKGFQVLYSKVHSVARLFQEHPDIAENFREKDQLVKTAYMNDLLSLIETLDKPPCSLSETELSKALRELIKLKKAGFKLNWLKKKHDEIFLERKKANFDGTQDQEFEEHMKNLKAEENKEKVKAAREDWLEGVVRSWNEWRVRMGFAGKAKIN